MPKPPSTPDRRRTDRLIEDLVHRVRADWPEWTDASTGDPGVTLLEVLAFLAEVLISRDREIPERRRRYLHATIARLEALLDASPGVDVTVDAEPWQQVPNLGGAMPDDPVYTVRPADEGEVVVVFGDGQHGRRPPEGSRLTASYRAGSGSQGATISTRWPCKDCSFDVAVADTVRFRRG